MLNTTKDMHKEKHIGSDFVTFEQQQLNGWFKYIAHCFSANIFQPIRQ